MRGDGASRSVMGVTGRLLLETRASRGGGRKRLRSNSTLPQLPGTPAYGGGKEYWNFRYTNEPDPFEWLRGFKDLQPIIDDLTGGDKETSVLNVGCGNSLLPEDMYDHGYHNIVNLDASAVVIEQMRARNTDRRADMQWLVGDALENRLANNSFGLVVDKSVLDTFACKTDSRTAIKAFINENMRVLKDDGAYLCISFGKPEDRMSYFKCHPSSINVELVELKPTDEKPRTHWCYICRKKGASVPVLSK
eukprot:gnl/TRDRNA2_/TRDRNA2_74320_c0_seq1.p1 gnl/TRDRNA2_/TRDRNA2_74320_c0~~gnl/TRDRNA2_/TRDRNA2_74320_c0_seq1.p1  ORF type:complete len:288 (+),score=36.57 gnl/TRDRNA2_/TRDRNA2_74320_c0_seq1:119-865(+)